MEADFNTALKIIFARRLMKNAEKSGLHDEQWGGRVNRSSIDAALQKLLTFEYGRYMKATIALFANDSSACFDRMYPALSNVIGRKFGLDHNVMHTRSRTMSLMKRSLRTDLGTSEGTYMNIPGEPSMEGEYQGKGDVAILWAITSHSVLTAYSTLHPPMILPDVANNQTNEKRNVSFVDDTDSLYGSQFSDPDTINEVVTQLAAGAQRWTNTLEVVGQSMAFHKSAWQILGYENNNGRMHILDKVPHHIELHDSGGATTRIRQIKSSEPNKGLGYYLTPDGNQNKEFEMRMAKTREVCRGVTSMHTSEHEAHAALFGRLIPQLRYGLQLTSFSERQCKKLDVVITHTFLSRFRIHRKTPRAVVHGPIELGGHGFPKCLSLQDKFSIPYVVRTLRWDGILAQDLLQTINAAQLTSGFVHQIFDYTNLRLDFIGIGWIPHLYARLKALEGKIWMEKAWRPTFQREFDSSIMESFAAIPKITCTMLTQANECRIYLRVITIAELADLNGTTINFDKLNGKWQAISMLNWPNQPSPNKQQWAAWRKCLRKTFCPRNSAYQRSGEYRLQQKLGTWLKTSRHVQYTAYASEQGYIWMTPNTIHMCKPKPIKGYYVIDHTISSLPLASHPINANYVHNGLWTHKAYRVIEETPATTTNYTVHDTINYSQHKKLTVVSDGSAFLDKQRSSYAYKITQERNHDHQLMATDLISCDVEKYAFRSELVGMHKGLQHANTINTDRTDITQYCDCKSAISRVLTPVRCPKQTMAPEADVVMAIQKEIDDSQNDIAIFHVEGHKEDELE